MSKSDSDLSADELTLPIKRTKGETLEERMTDNAYHNILPARYLRKDADGELVETQEELFERIGRNVALAEVVYEAKKRDVEVTVTPDQLKPGHPRRDELAEDVFGEGTSLGDDVEIELTEEIVSKFAYGTVVPELPTEIREHVESVADTFIEGMESLSFMPNSPTLMNAGDELQQLSACFVMSPEDDLTDIHETAKKAAEVFQSGGGVGYGFWQLRPYGDAVGSTGGIASGPITFMRTYDQLCETIAQGGTRRGAQMGIMRVSHPDVIEFIHAKNKDVSLAHCLRLNDPDDYTYTSFAEALEEARSLIDEDGRVPKHLRNAVEGHLSNFNISVGVTNEFMDALKNDEAYTFTNPRTGEPHVATAETKEMYDRYGLGEYVEVGEELCVPAEIIWERIIEGAHENGEPGVIYLERVNEEHSFDVEKHPDHRILATNPCVTGDTLISTERGLVPAETLYERGVATDVVVDGRLSEAPVKEASSVFKTGEKDVYKLTTEEGYELRLTADHRVMTDDGWVAASDLAAGDTVHVQNRKGSFGRHGTAEDGIVLGWLAATGRLDHADQTAVLSTDVEPTGHTAALEDAVRTVVGEPIETATVANHESGQTHQFRGDSGIEAHPNRIRSNRLYDLAIDAGLDEDGHGIPNAVLHGSEAMARGFLQAVFTANGYISEPTGTDVSVRLSSYNRRLLTDVQRLLLNFGIASKITDGAHDRNQILPQLTVTDETDSTKGKSVRDRNVTEHELVISNDNVVQFREEVGFLAESTTETLDERLAMPDRRSTDERFEATVESVSHDGYEAVYDLTEPDTHSFVANGIVVHNCGEQPLEEFEACNLGHINLSTLAALDAPDWRVWSAEHGNEYDSQAAAIEAFLEEALDWERFDERIEYGTRFLENVVTMSDFPVSEIEETVRRMRKIGLGIMGLAQLYIQLGVKYGSEEGNEIARQVMMHINHHAKWTSHELALERGSFADWNESKYADPPAYREWFEHQTDRSADEWADGFPIRNHNVTTIAPTGTTSMVGNTTGGCEPIYNVAYYKNVTDDVQGDEMLVEFDDYFLRTLEANDIDVDAVKEEAQEQMATNRFDGVEGLETVPDAIGELFVITSDLSAKEHAAVQCACQDGVDSAISKTVNAPNDSSLEDAKEVFEWVYEHGGKGVTYYRDGTRTKQVLTTRADNMEFADENEAVDVLLEQIDDIFGGFEEFLGQSDVESILEDEDLSLEDGATAEKSPATEAPSDFAEKRERPDALQGVSQRIDTGYGKVYVTINEDPETGQPFELFANIGHSGGFTNSFTEALAKVISTSLRSGVDPMEVVDELCGTRSPKVAWDKGEQIQSIPDAIGTAMRRYLDDEIDKPYPKQQTLEESAERDGHQSNEYDERPNTVNHETDGSGNGRHGGASDDVTQDLIDAGESPECPTCGSLSLYFAEGCKTCESCGWSEC